MSNELFKADSFLPPLVLFFLGSIIGAYLEWFCGIYAFLMPATVTGVCGALYSMSNASGQLQNIANASVEREVEDILTATRKALGSAAEHCAEDAEMLTAALLTRLVKLPAHADVRYLDAEQSAHRAVKRLLEEVGGSTDAAGNGLCFDNDGADAAGSVAHGV